MNVKKHFLKKVLNRLGPFLRPILLRYLSKRRVYTFQGIKIGVNPGVFHPGLFFSTKILLHYLSKEELREQTILELGAGSGLISIYCSKHGASVTASDITTIALENIKANAEMNDAAITIVKSDLFDDLDPNQFQWIVVNPPYYPKHVNSEMESAWFCGENFEYFEKFFYQLNSKLTIKNKIIMILSEDCKIDTIQSIARKYGKDLTLIFQKRVWGEMNFIFEIESILN